MQEFTMLYNGYTIRITFEGHITTHELKNIIYEVVSEILFEDNKKGCLEINENYYFFTLVDEDEIYIMQD